MATIKDLVSDAQDKFNKAQKTNEAIERVRSALQTTSDLAKLKGKR